MTRRSHYDVLGVAPDASPSAIRESYRRLARENHPDRAADAPDRGARMPDINAAYHVLSDPARRAVYDAQIRGDGVQPTVAAEAGPDEDAHVGARFPDGPARIPWRGLLVASVVAIVGLVIVSQFSDPPEPDAPDGILRSGDCVEILANQDAQEVNCTGTDDIVVRQVIAFDRECPNAWEPHRDRQGMGIACVEFVDGSLDTD